MTLTIEIIVFKQREDKHALTEYCMFTIKIVTVFNQIQQGYFMFTIEIQIRRD